MANKNISGFEEKIILQCGEDGFKAAKALLKNRRLSGAWRSAGNHLHGVFAPENGVIPEVELVTGDKPASRCNCQWHDYPLCPHGAAVIMHCGRFKLPDIDRPAGEPAYYAGLRQESWEQLSRHVPATPKAELFIESQCVDPHAPSQWENVNLSVKIHTRERDYLGNLNNLRQLYFDKSLSVVLKYEHFSLQEQQIIRFLALNGEPQGSHILLNADNTAEFFHILIDYPRFQRGGKLLKIRGDRVSAAILLNQRKASPGIIVSGAVLPAHASRLITGKSGCWIGCGSEYFFHPGTCEIGFLRNFFRTPSRTFQNDTELNDFLNKMPFPAIRIQNQDPETLPVKIILSGKFDADSQALELDYKLVYQLGSNTISLPPDSGELLIADGKFCRRNRKAERDFEQQLLMFGFTKTAPGVMYLEGLTPCGLFLEQALPSYLETNPEIALSGELARLKINRTLLDQAVLQCKYSGREERDFIIGYRLSANGCEISWDTVKNAAENYRRYLLINGCPVLLGDDLSKFFRAAAAIVTAVSDTDQTFRISHYNLDAFIKIASPLPGVLPPELTDSCRTSEMPPAPGGFNFTGTLRNYQQEGVDFLCWMNDRNLNVILADEMGLGKTVQLLAFLSKRLNREMPPALLICPASLVTNWERETEKFVPDLKICAPGRQVRKKFTTEDLIGTNLLILSYTGAKLSANILKKQTFSYLILDEAQHIKNPGSGNAKNCKDIPAQHRIVLSGTPLENSPDDLWSIMDFLHPGMLGSLSAFKKRYANGNPELKEELSCRIAPFIKRRLKKEVAADLPARTEKIIYCDLLPEQRELYEQILSEGQQEIASSAESHERYNTAIFNTLLKLRQVCCHPVLLDNEKYRDIGSAKAELLFELIQGNIYSSHKTLLFSQFTSLLKQLIPEFERLNIPFEYLDGSTRNRQERVDHFNNDPNVPLFLLSLKAGGTGLNLTSADTAIIYDPWWNPATENQAADRTHRIGQNRPVTIYKLVARQTIEEKILELQESKRQLFSEVIDGAAGKFKMNIEELKMLLEK